MKLPDVNVWLALAVSSHEHHHAAARWLDEQNEPQSIAFCRTTQQGYLRLLTQTPLMRQYQLPPQTNAQAWAACQVLMDDERVVFRAEPDDLERRWRDFAVRPTASSKLWMDAYLAAFALAAGIQMVTFDQGFKQFAGLDLMLLKS